MGYVMGQALLLMGGKRGAQGKKRVEPATCPEDCKNMRGGICRLACGNEKSDCPAMKKGARNGRTL